ncbi:bifunctional UDP-sugar hydrolase/5'-nucleotidase UshA [Pseudoalteromonas phenolica]|nr:bifunctional UDP-sugar hydrolase/5'-nucleotidase UshA [Pseudoalteromonas phenolica]MBE0357634.1 5'-nucleotidase / UDP-sugar diphosphatase [Pseudoalteromonas phenolica O-BC30]
MRKILTLSMAFALSGCTSFNIQQEEAEYLTILHTNDHHGRFWQNEKGEYGMSARKTLVDRLRKEAKIKGHTVLLLSGGDINTGVPESDLQYAEPDFKGMRLLGYDAMAIGNHEFDNPLHILDKQIEWARFPILSANIINKRDGSHAYKPYTILEKNGLKIGVIGLTTIDTVKIANPEYVGHLDFIKPSVAANKVLTEIEEKYSDIDVTIAVTHMGHYHDANFGINAPGDVTLARELPKGMLDMVIGGHSQEPVCMNTLGQPDKDFSPGKVCKPDNQNGTWIMQAHEWGKYVGKAEFKIQGNNVSLQNYQLIPVNLKDSKGKIIGEYIPEDKKMLALLKPFKKIGEGQLDLPIGYSDAYLDGKRDTVRFKQSPLAKLIIKAQKEAVDADFGLISGGGIRHSIEAGEISYKDVLKVHPFKNRITVMNWLGKDLLDYLQVVTSFPIDAGAYLQYEGLSFNRINGKLDNVKINGEPLELTKTYRMSINSYNAAGGDGYPILVGMEGFVPSDKTDAEVLKAYIEKHSPIKISEL